MRPTIFISSTIYDFKDLRSALKYNLEQLGCEVLLSEFNDFTKQLDINAFNACLETIKNVDYYILLIGSRVGGFYNQEEELTITRKEYQIAYEQAKRKRLKLLLFVRNDIWIVKEDREALQKILINDYCQNKELSDKDVQK